MKLLLPALVLLLAGCASNPPVPVIQSPVAESVELQLTDNPVAGLNVSIQIFTSDETPKSSIYVAASQVRQVEQRYLPYVLKRVLDRSGYWGAVRVLPERDPSAELSVSAKVVESSGTKLSLHVRVETATGNTWLDKVYDDVTDQLDYATDPDFNTDAFRDLYHRVANDMSQQLLELSQAERTEIVDAALMRYGQALSAEAFARYLETTPEGYVVTALPARGDPLLQNLIRIREAEYLFADSVDAHYEKLYRTVGPTYAWWRYYSYELIEGNERLERIDATRGASKGSWYAMERIYKTFKEAKMNQDALRELSESFERETEATTAQISGRVVELNGSLNEQYETWRSILQEMYDEQKVPGQ